MAAPRPDPTRPGPPPTDPPATGWTLVGRLTGAVVLAVVLAFALQALVIAWWVRPLTDKVGEALALQALAVHGALHALAPADREGFAARLPPAELQLSRQVPVLPGGPGAGPGPQAAPPPRDLAEQLMRRLGPDIEVWVQDGPGRRFTVLFGLKVDDERWWLRSVTDLPPPVALRTLLVWLALLGLVTAGALWLTVRYVARPLQSLARQIAGQAAATAGAGAGGGIALTPIEPGRHASAELHSLVRSFNALAEQVQRNAATRQQLLAGVSHDLRTPLARLKLRIETQCEPALAGRLDDDLRSLEHIVAQFLAYVQGEHAPPGPADGTGRPLHQLVAEVVQRRAADGDPVEARIDRGAAVPAGEVALGRLLGNLIDNALAHGRPPVEVVLEAHADGSAELRVIDHGPGLTPEAFERAQQPFVRLEHTRSDLGHCGLGLAIVAQIAHAGGLALACRHEPDGRFAVVVRWPASAGSVPAAQG